MKSVPDRVFFNDPSFFFSRTFYSRWAAHSSTTSTTSNYTAHFAQVIPRLRRRYIQPTRVSQLSHTSLPLSLSFSLSLSLPSFLPLSFTFSDPYLISPFSFPTENLSHLISFLHGDQFNDVPREARSPFLTSIALRMPKTKEELTNDDNFSSQFPMMWLNFYIDFKYVQSVIWCCLRTKGMHIL